MSVPTDTRFSFSELEPVVLGRVVKVEGMVSLLPPNLLQAWYRCRASGYVSVRQADRFAHFLGLHPGEIWANWFDE